MTFHLHASNLKVVVPRPPAPVQERKSVYICLCSSSEEGNCPAPERDRDKKAKGASLTRAQPELGFSPWGPCWSLMRIREPQPGHLPSVLFYKHRALDLILLRELGSPTETPCTLWMAHRQVNVSEHLERVLLPERLTGRW